MARRRRTSTSTAARTAPRQPLPPERAAARRSLGRITGTGLAEVTEGVGEVHRGISRRVFRGLRRAGLGPAVAPVRVLHDGISTGVYTAVRHGTRLGAAAGGEVAARVPQQAPAQDAAAVAERERKAHATTLVGFLNGAWGDHLSAAEDPLAWGTTLRHEGQDVPVEPAALAQAFTGAPGRLVVFLHGLLETERSWHLGGRRHWGDADATHGSRLADEHGLFPLYLRYCTGLPAAENGRRLDALLRALVAAWPGGVTDLVLVGHSMGGLVVRSACATAATRQEETGEDSPWLGLVRHTVSLGTPHLGAPLERGVARLVPHLDAVPELRPVARWLRSRSVGIKWLRHGALLEADVPDDVDDPREDPRATVPLLPHGRHHVLGVTLTQDPRGLATRMFGDGIVPPDSASGRHRDESRSVPFAASDVHVLGGLHHFDLLNHPRVYALLTSWLSGEEPAEGTVVAEGAGESPDVAG